MRRTPPRLPSQETPRYRILHLEHAQAVWAGATGQSCDRLDSDEAEYANRSDWRRCQIKRKSFRQPITLRLVMLCTVRSNTERSNLESWISSFKAARGIAFTRGSRQCSTRVRVFLERLLAGVISLRAFANSPTVPSRTQSKTDLGPKVIAQ